MDEKAYIYARLKYLNDEIETIHATLDRILDTQEKNMFALEKLADKVNEISSPEYIKNANHYNDMKDVMDKVEFMRSLAKKK